MSDDQDKKIAEAEARIEARKLSLEKEEKSQYLDDIEAKDILEQEHGTIAAVKVPRYKSGQPTRAFLRTPTTPEYKRYVSQVGVAVDKKKPAQVRVAQETLAKACWLYPESDEAKASMLDAFPGLYTPLGQAAAALAEGNAEDEGKG